MAEVLVDVSDVSEGVLMRMCGPLYPAIATEAFSSLLLFVLFSYIVLVVKTQTRIHAPGKAVVRMLSSAIRAALHEFISTARTWHKMPSLPLKDRFKFCRKMNEMICMFSALNALLSVTRWLHIGNVNGFRYLGYAFTCPIMQAEMVILIAPVVPCFRFNAILTSSITCVTLLAGYVASTLDMNFYEGSLDNFSIQEAVSGDFSDVRPTLKFWWTMSSMFGMVFLTVVQMPWLCLLYTCRGGVSGGLPWGFRRLLTIVAVTWLGFPLWWFISFEGMNIVSDTKLNGLGFAFLNIISKALFSWQVLQMVGWHRRAEKEEKKAEKAKKAAHAMGMSAAGGAQDVLNAQIAQDPLQRQLSPDSCSDEGLKPQPRAPSNDSVLSIASMSSVNSTDMSLGFFLSAPICANSLSPPDCEEDPWFVKLLLPYDSVDPNSGETSPKMSARSLLNPENDVMSFFDLSPEVRKEDSLLSLNEHDNNFLSAAGVSPGDVEMLSVEEKVRIRILYDTMPLLSDGFLELMRSFETRSSKAGVTDSFIKSSLDSKPLYTEPSCTDASLLFADRHVDPSKTWDGHFPVHTERYMRMSISSDWSDLVPSVTLL